MLATQGVSQNLPEISAFWIPPGDVIRGGEQVLYINPLQHSYLPKSLDSFLYTKDITKSQYHVV